MSTNSECLIVEYEPNSWYYLLEHMHAPKNAGDWREYASLSGPFPTEDAAIRHLQDYNANPGGYSTLSYNPRNHDEALAAHVQALKLKLGHPRFNAASVTAEISRGQWWLLAEDVESTNTSENWLERANAYGPFATASAAQAAFGTVKRSSGFGAYSYPVPQDAYFRKTLEEKIPTATITPKMQVAVKEDHERTQAVRRQMGRRYPFGVGF